MVKEAALRLDSDGCAFIDIYAPWYWSKNAGQEMVLGKARRKYDFDFRENRMLDTWYEGEGSNKSVTQSLRCYSPEDLLLLLEGTGLQLIDLKAGGALNYKTSVYSDNVLLGEAMSYIVKLKKQ